MNSTPSNTDRTEFRSTTAAAGLISATALVGAVFGFMLQLLVAYFFGASGATDAYFMALSTSEMLSKLLLGGSITAVFIPLFVEHYTRGDRDTAWFMALNIIHVFSSVFLFLIILLGIFTTPFVHVIAPGFDEPATQVTVRLIRILLPAFLLLFVVELLSSVLYAVKQFFVPALLRILSPIVSIIIIIATAPLIGIYSLAVGVVCASVLQIAVLLWGISRQGFSYRFVYLPLHGHIKHLLFLVYPFIISVLATQAAGIVYRILVSGLHEGSLSSLRFAEKITQFLTLVFLSSVTVVLYPLLSEKASKQDFAGIRATLGAAIRLITLVSVPLVIGVIILRDPLIRFVYERGNFSADDAAQTSIALLFLTLGITINGISALLGNTTMALQKTKAAVAVTVTSQIIAIALFYFLVPVMGHAGLALASSLVPVAITALYFIYLKQFIPDLYRIFWHVTFAKIGGLAALLGFVVYGAFTLVDRLTVSVSLVTTVAELLIPSLIGFFVFFGGAYLLHIPEMKDLVSLVAKKWRTILSMMYAFRRS